MWDLPGPGLDTVSPALAGGFLTTAPPGKPQEPLLNYPVIDLTVPQILNYHFDIQFRLYYETHFSNLLQSCHLILLRSAVSQLIEK